MTTAAPRPAYRDRTPVVANRILLSSRTKCFSRTDARAAVGGLMRWRRLIVVAQYLCTSGREAARTGFDPLHRREA
jgi:hypothetical protein